MEIVIIVSLLSLYCDFTDAECRVVSPARLMVKYGDKASSNCTSDTPVQMGWEATQGGVALTEEKVTFLLWREDNVTDWGIKPMCFTEGVQCDKHLDITVYKLPDVVSISYSSHPDPMCEQHQYLLQCLVQNIAPTDRLRVTFYKVNTNGELTELDTQQKSNGNIKTPVNRTFTLDFTPSRDDDGAQLWCSAMLDLGPEGPQLPPVMKSDRLNIAVHYKPQITMTPGCFSMSITEGDTLSLNCSAKALLCCPVVDYLPILAGLAAVVILLVISCFIYSSYHKHTLMGHYAERHVATTTQEQTRGAPQRNGPVYHVEETGLM